MIFDLEELSFNKMSPIFVGSLEIVIKELRQLRMSADFFANTSHDISRYPGV